MYSIRVLSPRAHRLLWPRIQSQVCNKRPIQFTQTAFFRTSLGPFNQIKSPEKKHIPSVDTKVKDEQKLLIAEEKPKLDISSEIYTIPNLLTLSRIATTPFIGYFLATGKTVPAIAIFTYSCVTDFVDGYIARRFNMKSVLGSILDPAADKFLMTTCTVALGIPGLMPLYVASAIIGRDVILSFIGFYVRYVSLPPPVTLKKFLDMSITTHTVHPNLLGKANTTFQMIYIGGLVLKPALESFFVIDLAGSFDWFGMFVAASTVCSGLSYVIGKNSFKSILKPGTK